MDMCKKCSGVCGWTFLILGVLFLVRDFTGWAFWGIQWWSVVFVIMGMKLVGSSQCKDCLGKK